MDMVRMLRDYRVSGRDVENLKTLYPIMERHKAALAERLFDYIMEDEETSKFFPDEDVKRRHKEHVQEWFMRLFSGEYDESYLSYLQKIGYRHVRVGIAVHYVTAAMNVVRSFAIETIEKEMGPSERMPYIASLNKMLDLNLDLITSAYREEELRTVFVSYRFESYLIEFAKRFTYGLNLVLVVALIAISFLVVGLFAYDVSHILEGKVSEGILSAIGSLLILWVMIELLDAEVRHLRGGKFAIKIFVGVALVALIRELLLSSFQEAGGMQRQYFFAASIFVLGVVYWLISRTEGTD